MFGLGPSEMIIVLVIVLIIFGAGRLPEIGKGLGQAIQNFKKSTKEPPEIDVTPDKTKSQEEKRLEGENVEKK